MSRAARSGMLAAALAVTLAAMVGPGPARGADTGAGFSVRITHPGPGDFVFGRATVTAEVQANEPALVAKVEFYVDSRLIFIDKEAPYEFVYEFGNDPRSFVLRAEAYRRDGRTTSDTVVTRRLVINYQTAVDRVILNATAMDDDGEPVLDMTGEDFTLLEDGVPQTILDFYVEERPIALALILDTSGSMRDAMAGAQVAASGFVDTLEEEDRALLIDFDEKVFLLHELTGDTEALQTSIQSTYPQGGTAVYDALYSAFRLLNEVEGRKAIILLTDGDDHDSHFSLERIEETARSSEVVIYSIGLGSGIRKKPLQDLAAETGGRAYFPGTVEKLRDVYARVARELRSQYYLTYSSTNSESDGGYRKIKLNSNRPDVEIHTRRGYYAVKRSDS